jgi:hypothetical protein
MRSGARCYGLRSVEPFETRRISSAWPRLLRADTQRPFQSGANQQCRKLSEKSARNVRHESRRRYDIGMPHAGWADAVVVGVQSGPTSPPAAALGSRGYNGGCLGCLCPAGTFLGTAPASTCMLRTEAAGIGRSRVG